jgi:sulfur dioxygenase
MYFRMLQDEATGALSYLLADLDAGEAVLIDPRGADAAVLQAMLSEHRLRLRWLVRTHLHAEAQTAEDEAALDGLGAPRVERKLPPGGVLPFGSEHLGVVATPGHTTSCLSFRWRDRLFCGDALAVDSCPYQRQPQAPAALWDSVVHGIFTLPAETLLFCAHGRDARAVSTVLEQRRGHPWFARASRDEFLGRFREPAEALA